MTSNDDSQVFDAEHIDPDRTPNTSGYAGNFVHSFGHALVQAPLDGVREVVNGISRTKIVPKIEIVKPPEKAEISTPEWEAQKFGTGAGLIAAVFIIGKLLSRR
jgi:hypothetical protein